MATIPEEITDVLNRLPLDKQRRVLDFARSLEIPQTPPPGKPASDLLNFRPTLSPEDIELMRRAIEEDCETIEPDEK